MGLTKDVFDEYGNYKYPDYSNSQYINYATATGGVMMRMTIEEHIAQLKKLKSFHNGSYGASVKVAINVMRKYQKIEDLVNDCADESVDDTSCCARYIGLIEEIIYTEEQEDGNDI